MLNRDKTETSLEVTIGLEMRRLRKAKGMSLQDIATMINTTPQTLQRLETANMTISIYWVERIAKALGCQPYELFIAHGSEMKSSRRQMIAMREEAEALKLRLEQGARFIAAFMENTSPVVSSNSLEKEEAVGR